MLQIKLKSLLEIKICFYNMLLIQAYDSVMCGYFCEFIDFMLKYKSLTDFNNLVSPNDLKNDDIILSYFKNGWST